jgi:hypothetical protein
MPSQSAQRWMNASCAILTVMTRRVPRHDCLGGAPKNPESTGTTRKILSGSWDIESRDKLLGHRAEGAPLAWDLVRLVAVTGWGYVADYISEEEAWGFIAPAAKQLQQTYQSWEHLGRTYVEGTFWWKDEAGPGCQKIYDGLVNDPQSPWRSVPWSWNLDAPDPKEKSSNAATYLIIAVAVIGIGSVGAFMAKNALKKAKTEVAEKTEKSEKSEKSEPKTTEPKKGSWDGKSPFTCGGSQTVKIEGVTADLGDATALSALGGCHLTLENVNVKAKTALLAGGSAVVEIHGGSLTGTEAAISAGGGAKVTVIGTKLTGATQKGGGATVEEKP